MFIKIIELLLVEEVLLDIYQMEIFKFYMQMEILHNIKITLGQK